jgi:inward rectifier potassium channel
MAKYYREKKMEEKSLDPGLGEKYLGNASRMINTDGSFNIHRTGIAFHYKDLYHFLINLSWSKFFLLTFSVYVFANIFFASLYSFIGTNNLVGTHDGSLHNSFWDGLFFSVQTLTTVGYGGIIPYGIAANILAALEAMIGLLGFAIITGLLYGRFSKPTARILYSKKAVISLYSGKQALMFRIANQRKTNLMEIEARVLLAYIDLNSQDQARKYKELKLERNSVNFLSLNWTLVHQIDGKSPLLNKTTDDLQAMHAEILILIKGFDETFSQNVHSRYSYRYDEIIWGVKFKKAYVTNNQGKIVFDVNNIHQYEQE